MSACGLGGKFSERSRQALLSIPGIDDAVRLSLVGEPPAGFEGYEVRPGLRTRKWPSRYLTADVARIANLFRLAELGMPPLTTGAVHWPPPLVQAFVWLAAERQVARG